MEHNGVIDDDGWLTGWPGSQRMDSPNFDQRPGDESPSLLVVHAISLPPESFGGPHIAALFTNALDPSQHPYFETIQDLRVSSHFLVRRDGALVQFVSCNARAWHAGVSVWRGRERCNDYSIGIELEGSDTQPFEAAQYAALAALTRALEARYALTDMVGHCDIAPGRKTDPGPFFEWPRLRQLMGGGPPNDDARAVSDA